MNDLYELCTIVDTRTPNHQPIFHGNFRDLYNLLVYNLGHTDLSYNEDESYYQNLLPKHWELSLDFKIDEKEIKRWIDELTAYHKEQSDKFDKEFGQLSMEELLRFDWSHYLTKLLGEKPKASFESLDEYEQMMDAIHHKDEMVAQACFRLMDSNTIHLVSDDVLQELMKTCGHEFVQDTFMFVEELYVAKLSDSYDDYYIIRKIYGQGETSWHIDSTDAFLKNLSDYKEQLLTKESFATLNKLVDLTYAELN